MTRLSAALILCASTATAQGIFPREAYEVHHDNTAGDAWFARVTIWNPDGSANSDWIIPTEAGDVTMTYRSSPNGCQVDPTPCRDRVTITDLPEGIAPSEWQADIDENTTYTIYLYRYLGG